MGMLSPPEPPPRDPTVRLILAAVAVSVLLLGIVAAVAAWVFLAPPRGRVREPVVQLRRGMGLPDPPALQEAYARFERQLDRAWQAQQEGLDDRALLEYGRALKTAEQELVPRDWYVGYARLYRGRFYLGAERYPEALRDLEESLELLRGQEAPLGEVYLALAQAEMECRRLDRATADFAAARRALEEEPEEDSSDWRERTWPLIYLATSLGYNRDAETLVTAALEKDDGKSPRFHRWLLVRAGFAHADAGHLDQAEEAWRKAARGATDESPDLVAEALCGLASLEASRGRLAQGRDLAGQALAGWEESEGEDAGTTQRIHLTLAMVDLHSGRWREADHHVKVAEGSEDERIRSYARRLRVVVLSLAGRLEEAGALVEEGLRIEDPEKPRHLETLVSLCHLRSSVAGDLGRPDEALRHAEEAARFEARVPQPASLARAWTRFYLGEARMLKGQAAAAEEQYRQALKALDEAGFRAGPTLALMRCSLGEALLEQGRLDLAEAEFRAAGRLVDALGVRHHYAGEVARGLGRLRLRQGRAEEGRRLLRQALEVRQATLGPGHPFINQSRADLAAVGR